MLAAPVAAPGIEPPTQPAAFAACASVPTRAVRGPPTSVAMRTIDGRLSPTCSASGASAILESFRPRVPRALCAQNGGRGPSQLSTTPTHRLADQESSSDDVLNQLGGPRSDARAAAAATASSPASAPSCGLDAVPSCSVRRRDYFIWHVDNSACLRVGPSSTVIRHCSCEARGSHFARIDRRCRADRTKATSPPGSAKGRFSSHRRLSCRGSRPATTAFAWPSRCRARVCRRKAATGFSPRLRPHEPGLGHLCASCRAISAAFRSTSALRPVGWTSDCRRGLASRLETVADAADLSASRCSASRKARRRRRVPGPPSRCVSSRCARRLARAGWCGEYRADARGRNEAGSPARWGSAAVVSQFFTSSSSRRNRRPHEGSTARSHLDSATNEARFRRCSPHRRRRASAAGRLPALFLNSTDDVLSGRRRSLIAEAIPARASCLREPQHLFSKTIRAGRGVCLVRPFIASRLTVSRCARPERRQRRSRLAAALVADVAPSALAAADCRIDERQRHDARCAGCLRSAVSHRAPATVPRSPRHGPRAMPSGRAQRHARLAASSATDSFRRRANDLPEQPRLSVRPDRRTQSGWNSLNAYFAASGRHSGHASATTLPPPSSTPGGRSANISPSVAARRAMPTLHHLGIELLEFGSNSQRRCGSARCQLGQRSRFGRPAGALARKAGGGRASPHLLHVRDGMHRPRRGGRAERGHPASSACE